VSLLLKPLKKTIKCNVWLSIINTLGVTLWCLVSYPRMQTSVVSGCS